jgi:VanZ family protein
MKGLLRLLPIVYMAIVWIQSSYSSDQFVQLSNSWWDNNIKESLHLIEFAILYVLLVLAFSTRRGGLTRGSNVLCAVIAALWGITDEIHQSFVPYRSSTLFDFVKDIIGISVCFYFIRGALFKGKFKRLNSWLKSIEGK